MQGSQEQEVKLQNPRLQNFRTIAGHFCWFHETQTQDTENALFSVLHKCYSLQQISIAVLKMLS